MNLSLVSQMSMTIEAEDAAAKPGAAPPAARSPQAAPAPTDDEAAIRLQLFPRGLPAMLDTGHYGATSSDSDFSYGQEVFQKAVAAERREREKQALLEEQARMTKMRMQAAMTTLLAALPQAPATTNVETVVARASDYIHQLSETVDSANHDNLKLSRRIASLAASQRDGELGKTGSYHSMPPSSDGSNQLLPHFEPVEQPALGVPPWIPTRKARRNSEGVQLSPTARPTGPTARCTPTPSLNLTAHHIASPSPPRRTDAASGSRSHAAALRWALTYIAMGAVGTLLVASPRRLATAALAAPAALRKLWGALQSRADGVSLDVAVPYRVGGLNLLPMLTAWLAVLVMRRSRALLQLACRVLLKVLDDAPEKRPGPAGLPVLALPPGDEDAADPPGRQVSRPPLSPIVADAEGRGRLSSRGYDSTETRSLVLNRAHLNPAVKTKAQSNVMAYLYSEGIEPWGVVVEPRSAGGDGGQPAFRSRSTSYHPDNIPSPAQPHLRAAAHSSASATSRNGKAARNR